MAAQPTSGGGELLVRALAGVVAGGDVGLEGDAQVGLALLGGDHRVQQLFHGGESRHHAVVTGEHLAVQVARRLQAVVVFGVGERAGALAGQLAHDLVDLDGDRLHADQFLGHAIEEVVEEGVAARAEVRDHRQEGLLQVVVGHLAGDVLQVLDVDDEGLAAHAGGGDVFTRALDLVDCDRRLVDDHLGTLGQITDRRATTDFRVDLRTQCGARVVGGGEERQHGGGDQADVRLDLGQAHGVRLGLIHGKFSCIVDIVSCANARGTGSRTLFTRCSGFM